MFLHLRAETAEFGCDCRICLGKVFLEGLAPAEGIRAAMIMSSASSRGISTSLKLRRDKPAGQAISSGCLILESSMPAVA